MIFFPNCKINLGLNIIQKRADGYHDLETVFYPLQINDALEIIQTSSVGTGSFCYLSISGLKIEGSITNNLCVKAVEILKKDFPFLPPITMHLHKKIPMGAGLGGGSSDAAFTLLLLNKKFNLNISKEQLITYALQLGSDCPFFILNKPCLATGRGEILDEIKINLSSYYFVIVNPGIHINTSWAFSKIIPQKPQPSIRQIITQPIETWKENLRNDFEKPIAENYPEIQLIKEQLYNYGALYSSMTGSGSSIFGIFEKQPTSLNFPESYFMQQIKPANN